MMTSFTEPVLEGFRDSLRLWAGIVIALVSVVAAFAAHSQNIVPANPYANQHPKDSG